MESSTYGVEGSDIRITLSGDAEVAAVERADVFAVSEPSPFEENIEALQEFALDYPAGLLAFAFGAALLAALNRPGCRASNR